MSGIKRKKLLFVTTSLGTGGAERVLYLLCDQLHKELDIKVITLSEGSYSAKLRAIGIQVESLKFDSILAFITSFLNIIKFTSEFKPNLIQGWMYHGNLFAHVLRLFSLKSKLYIGIRQSLPDIKLEKKFTQLVIALDAFLSRFAHLVIFNSYKGQEDHTRFGYKPKNIVIPNGVDTKKFKPLKGAKQDLCKKLNLPHDSILIGMIARFHPIKDHKTFFEAATEFSKKHPKTHYILSGQNIDNKNEELIDLISKYPEIQDQVHLLGTVDNVEEMTAALDISVNCSISEGMPNNIIEAMSSGVLVVATDVGDSKIIIENEKLIVKPSSPSDLCKVWNNAIASDKKNIQEQLREKVEKKYSLNSMISNFQKIYLNA